MPFRISHGLIAEGMSTKVKKKWKKRMSTVIAWTEAKLAARGTQFSSWLRVRTRATLSGWAAPDAL